MSDDSDVFSILVDDRRRRRIFAATCGGIYRSLDAGEGWTKMNEAKGASFRTYHLAQNLQQPNVLMAGTSAGLIKSVDSGNTWKKVSSQSTRWIAFDPAEPNRVFVATDEAGLLRSNDAGESFQPINQGFTNRHFASLRAEEDSLYVTTLYVTTLTAGGSAILRRSDLDSGWKELRAAAGTKQREMQTEFLEDDLQAQDVIATEDGDLLAATSRGLAKSRDAGLTWQLEPGMLDGTSVGALCKHPARAGVLFASTFGQIYRSNDGGGTWTPLRVGADGPDDVIALLVLPGGPDRLLALSRTRGVYAIDLPD